MEKSEDDASLLRLNELRLESLQRAERLHRKRVEFVMAQQAIVQTHAAKFVPLLEALQRDPKAQVSVDGLVEVLTLMNEMAAEKRQDIQDVKADLHFERGVQALLRRRVRKRERAMVTRDIANAESSKKLRKQAAEDHKVVKELKKQEDAMKGIDQEIEQLLNDSKEDRKAESLRASSQPKVGVRQLVDSGIMADLLASFKEQEEEPRQEEERGEEEEEEEQEQEEHSRTATVLVE